jgi:hypothetical protein
MTSGKEKTIGELIDSLITTDLRCWMAQEDIMNESLSTEQRLAAAIRAQEQNAKRSQLISTKCLERRALQEPRLIPISRRGNEGIDIWDYRAGR